MSNERRHHAGPPGRQQETAVYRCCPSCESNNAVVYERGEGESFCLDCNFTWWQSENVISVSRTMLERIAGLRTTPETTDH
jgi:hypothetical protein